MVRLLLVLAACLASMLACTPRMDWREMPAANGQLVVLFPAKPVSATRTLPLAGQSYALTMTAARVGSAQFAAGHLEAANGQAESAARAWAAAMLANIDAKAPPTALEPVTVRAAQGALQVRGQGAIDGQPGRLLARFAWRDHSVVAAIAMGPASDLSEDDAQTFVTSLRLP
jgi:hypothetical protein